MKQDSQAKQSRIKIEYLTHCLPRNVNEVLYTLYILIYLICAVIHFAHTSDTTMLVTLLPYLSAYVGIHNVAPLLSWKKKDGEVQDPDRKKKL